MHEVLVNRLGGLSLPRKSVVRLNDRPDMTLDVYHGRKTTIQRYNNIYIDIDPHMGFSSNFLLKIVPLLMSWYFICVDCKINFAPTVY